VFRSSRSRTFRKARGIRGVWLALVVVSLLAAPPAAAQPAPDPTDLDMDGIPGVAASPSPGSEIPEVFALTGPGSLLVDRSHSETFNVSGFTSFLASQGWTIASNASSPITEAILAPYDVFMVPVGGFSGITPFTAAEVSAVNAYLSNGGGLWLFNEYSVNPAGINTLSSALGVTFHQDFISDATNNEGEVFWPTIHLLESHPITQGVTSYGYYGGCCLSVVSPALIIGRGDDDASSADCPTFPAMLAAYESSGRVVFSGDITPLHSNYYPENLRDEEELLLQNIANWLAQKPPTAAESISWGAIKMLYPPR